MILERFFQLEKHGTTVRTEVIGGITTFVTMAYIIVVNPAILSFAGIPVGPSTVATILAAVFGCLVMGLYANRPFAVAPYMGENAFIAFGLASLGISWQVRLGAVFLGGVLFLVLTFAGIRQWLVHAISASLKRAIAVSIGLFLAFIGLYETGIVTSAAAGMPAASLTAADGLLRAPDVPVKIGALHDPKVLLAIGNFFLIAVLMKYRVKAAILIGIVTSGVIGVLAGFAEPPRGIVAVPFTGEASLAPLFLQLDIPGALNLSLWAVILTLMIMAFLDTTGTLVGLGAAVNALDEKGDLPDIERPMITDALACMFAPLVGTSTTGAYIESAAGIQEGARTGLSTVVVGLLFAVALFFVPLLTPFQAMTYTYGPALVMVGIMMLPAIKHFDFEDLTEAVPAFLAITLTVFTYNIANGLSAALAVYPFLKLATGRGREVKPGAWILGLLCLSYYVFGIQH